MSDARALERRPASDDRTVEALLASVCEPCIAQQLASALDWGLPRTTDALNRLGARFATTGQTLQQLGHQTYALAPRPGIVDEAQIARCLRQHRQRLDPVSARVLHRALTRPGRERARNTLEGPEELAARRLIAAGILEDKAGLLRPTERTEVTFGICSIRRRGSSPSIQTLLEC